MRTLFLIVALSCNLAAQSGLVGSWRLVSIKETTADGEVLTQSFGARPSGYLTYTADGFMQVVIAYDSRPPLSVNDRAAAPEAERARAFATSFAYAATYSVSGDTVTHNVLASSVPNWVGRDLVRRFKLNGDRLLLVTQGTIQVAGNTIARSELIWERIRGRAHGFPPRPASPPSN